MEPPSPRGYRTTLASKPVDSCNPFLYHKTTHRTVYEAARSDFPGFDDVLLWNEREEITEFTIGNVVLKLDFDLYTPPVQSGLLPGTFRRKMLEQHLVKEKTLHVEDLEKAKAIYLINSVREWVTVTWTQTARGEYPTLPTKVIQPLEA